MTRPKEHLWGLLVSLVVGIVTMVSIVYVVLDHAAHDVLLR
jgi:hypothetical protein